VGSGPQLGARRGEQHQHWSPQVRGS
jgi:hypothetical protein